MKFNKNDISMGLLVAFIVKNLFFSSNISDMGIALGLIGMVALKEYIAKHSDIQDMKKIVEKQSQVIEKMAQEIVLCKESVSGLKMQTGMKSHTFPGTRS